MAGTTLPTEFVLRRDEVMPVILRLVVERPVVVAPVPVAFVKVKVESVDEAGARKPFRKARVVEVACSLVPSFVNGQEKVDAAGNEVRQSPERQKVVAARFVEVAFVVVPFVAVKDWRVEEPVARKLVE